MTKKGGRQPEGDCYPMGGGGAGAYGKKVSMGNMKVAGAHEGKGKAHMMKGEGAGSQHRSVRQTSKANHEEMVMSGMGKPKGFMARRLSKRGY